MRLSEEIPSVLSIIIKYKCSVSENKTLSVSLFVMSDFMPVLLEISIKIAVYGSYTSLS